MSRRQEVAILSTEALKQLTCTVVKEQSSAPSTSNSIQNAKEPHPKVYHSVKKAPRQQEACSSRDVATPTSRTDSTSVDTFGCSRLLGVTVNIVSPTRCLLSRSLSSSVDSSSDVMDSSMISHHSIAQDEEYEVVGAGTNTLTRPSTLSLDREMSSTSSGSGKTTPCNIPRLPSSGQSSCIRSPVEEKLASSYPGPMPSCSPPVQRGGAEVVMETRNGSQHQPLCQAEKRLNQLALARRIADRLKMIGDQVATDADNEHVSELMDGILRSLSSGLTWSGVVSMFRGLSHVLAQWYREAPSDRLYETFSDLWKQVLRHIVGWITDNGGWNAFFRETDHSASVDHSASDSHMTSSLTPDVPRRCSTSDAVGHIYYSTPQAPRRGFPTIQSSPSLIAGCSAHGNRGNESPIHPAGCSARGNERGCRVLSLAEDGVFHLDESFSFLTDSGRYVEEELKSHDEAIFSNVSSQSSFSDMPESPISLRPRPQSGSLVPEATSMEKPSSALTRSHSVPIKKRTGSTRLTRGAEVISEREHSVDSGLEASSEVSLTSATSVDSFVSLQHSSLRVSAMCILEAVRLMLDADS